MKRILTHCFRLLFITVMVACNFSQTTTMKNVTGRAGDLVIVVNNDIWKGEVDTLLTNILTQPQLGLPQLESIFDLTHIPYEAFGDIFKTSRNLILIDIDQSCDSAGVLFLKDMYSNPQAVVSITAKNKADFLGLFNSNSDKIIGYFLRAEKDRLMMNYKKFSEKEVSKKTDELFSLTINVPAGFKVAETKDDFMWVRYETPEISQGIIIYSYPYVSDSTFTLEYLKIKRNLFVKNNIPGPLDGSYMTTEKEMPLTFNTFKKDGNFAAELRGLWRLENDFMGGPFVSISIIDLLKNRVVTLEGFVYAPSKDKRNLLRQVEAMIYSVKFSNQKDMDKINKQFEY